MNYEFVSTQAQLDAFCRASQGAPWLGFDTEFVSENLYRPQLCLVQAVTPERAVLIDTLAIERLHPFWDLITTGVERVIAHAAREEFLFCLRACGKRPANLFDLQIAAGMAGFDYPAAYSTLVSEVTGIVLSKGETRTDWRQRPLSSKQRQYAIQDVEHLEALYLHLKKRLSDKKRLDWYEEEIGLWQTQIEAVEAQPAWMRLSGVSKLSRRSLAIVARLSDWRDETACMANRSPRRILPDDLLIEIAKRGEGDISRLKAIRGLQNRVSAKYLEDIAAQIAIGVAVPEPELPARIRSQPSVNVGIVGQFLQTALNLICVREGIAPSLVATTQDVRDLAASLMKISGAATGLRLEQGWRREIVGLSFRKLLDGRLALRIADVSREQPLELVPWDEILRDDSR